MDIIIYFAAIVLLCVVAILPQKKRQKQEAQIRASIQIGDKITTIGGITGIVHSMSGEDANETIILQTGDSHIEIRKWAIQSKDTLIEVKADGDKNDKSNDKQKAKA